MRQCITAFGVTVIYLTMIAGWISVLVGCKLTTVSKFWFAWKSWYLHRISLMHKSVNYTISLLSKQLGSQGWMKLDWLDCSFVLNPPYFMLPYMLVVWQMKRLLPLLFPPPLNASAWKRMHHYSTAVQSTDGSSGVFLIWIAQGRCMTFLF